VRSLLVAVLVATALVVTALPVATQRWTPPKTPWGEPDVQGYWTATDILGMPVERPVNLGEKAFYTDEELKQLSDKPYIRGANDAFFGESRDHWRDYGTPQKQTSMIVDPPNGRLPPMTPDGARRQPLIPNESKGNLRDVSGVSPTARCISRGVYGSMLPIGNSSGNHVVQSPGVVAIRNEMIHETRVIHTDGRSHVGTAISGYMGDSKGRWEGDVLVVDTTNIKPGSGQGPGLLMTNDTHMVERFTPLDAQTMQYRVTIDDPRTWTRPWTATYPLKRDSGYYLFEFACHEGNFLSMTSMLIGGRPVEK
jgi:hypothetical protein